MSTRLSAAEAHTRKYGEFTISTWHHNKDEVIKELFGRSERAQKEALVTLIDWQIAQLKERIEATDEAIARVHKEVGEDSDRRAPVQQAQLALSNQLARSRAYLSMHAPRRLDRVGMGAPPPASRDELRTYTKRLLPLLREHAFSIEDDYGNTTTHAQIADAIGAPYESFERAIEGLIDEERDTVNARDERDRRREELHLWLHQTAAMIESILRLAKRDYQADRIRPTHSRVTGEEEVDIPQDDPA